MDGSPVLVEEGVERARRLLGLFLSWWFLEEDAKCGGEPVVGKDARSEAFPKAMECRAELLGVRDVGRLAFDEGCDPLQIDTFRDRNCNGNFESLIVLVRDVFVEAIGDDVVDVEDLHLAELG